MADLEEAVTAGVAANAFVVAETADEFERSFLKAIEFASLAMMRDVQRNGRGQCVDSIRMANERRFGPVDENSVCMESRHLRARKQFGLLRYVSGL